MRLCTDCQHFQALYCRRPTGRVSPVDGTPYASVSPAGQERSGGKVVAWLTQSCGEAGRFFEPKQ